MEILTKTIAIITAVLLCVPVMAQGDAEPAERRLQQEAEDAVRAHEMRQAEDMQHAETNEQRSAQYEAEVRMRDAERRMAEAARQVADLSMAQLPRVEGLERIIRGSRGPMLGISIGADEGDSPVEGVEILGVSPGGAAADAGLRSGDVITSINKESLTADSSQKASDKLLDFMQGVEVGDALAVEYLRDGKTAVTEITPRPMGSNVFAFDFNDGNFAVPNVHVAPNAAPFGGFIWRSDADGFGAMELAQLSERLGTYFGTSEGLLVVSAPGNKDLQLEDGDVILSIDGRNPTSVAHAMRILGSYESGEELKIEIMRDKRKQTISLKIPDNRRGANVPDFTTHPPVEIHKKVVVVDNDGI